MTRNSSQGETGTRDAPTDGGEAAGTDAEGQGSADRPEARVEGPEVGCEVSTGRP